MYTRLNWVKSKFPYFLCRTDVMGTAKKTGRSFHCNWTKNTMCYLSHSPTVWFEFPSAGVSVMGHAKSKTFSPTFSTKLSRKSFKGSNKLISSPLDLPQGLHCLSGSLLWLAETQDLRKSETEHVVSSSFYIYAW